MNSSQNYDVILKEAINEYMDDILESQTYREDKFSCSDKFEKKTSKLIKSNYSYYHKLTLTKARKIVCIIIAILLLLLSSLSVGAVRDFIADFFIEHFSVYDTVSPKQDKVENYPKTIESVYELGHIPKGYSLVDKSKMDNSITYIYSDKSGNTLVFSQDTQEIYSSNIDNEHSSKYSETIEGQEYLINIFEDSELEKPSITVVWDNGEYIFTLFGNLTKKEMIDMCKSLKK